MTPYSVQSRDRIFVKGYECLSFVRNMGKNIGKIISKNLSRKYSQKPLDHAKQSATDALKTASKRVIQKPAEAKIYAGKIYISRIKKANYCRIKINIII